jgi:hypothetical protein
MLGQSTANLGGKCAISLGRATLELGTQGARHLRGDDDFRLVLGSSKHAVSLYKAAAVRWIAYADSDVSATRTTPSVCVECDDCGAGFELSVRQEYQHRREGKPLRCRICRLPGTEISRERVEDAKRWWLAHYSLDELRSWPSL